MRKDFGKGHTLFPAPVFVIGTYDKKGNPDAMIAAWGCISEVNQITIFVSSTHKTMENILENKDFTISMATKKYVKECDYLGIVSGNEVDNKIEVIGFHHQKANNVNAPIFEELPMTLECRMLSFDKETEALVGEIVNISADESILTNGKIDADKLEPITYDSSFQSYRVLGNQVGLAWKDGLEYKK